MTKLNQFDALGLSDDNNDFVQAVDNIKQRGETLQMDVQKYLLAVATRWVESGDSRPVAGRINMLINEAPKGFRINALKAWTEAWLGMIMVEEGDNAGQFVMGTTKAKDLDLPEMLKRENYWFKFVPEPTYHPVNLDAMIAIILKKADKRQKDGLKDSDAIDPEKLAKLKELFPTTA